MPSMATQISLPTLTANELQDFGVYAWLMLLCGVLKLGANFGDDNSFPTTAERDQIAAFTWVTLVFILLAVMLLLPQMLHGRMTLLAVSVLSFLAVCGGFGSVLADLYAWHHFDPLGTNWNTISPKDNVLYEADAKENILTSESRHRLAALNAIRWNTVGFTFIFHSAATAVAICCVHRLYRCLSYDLRDQRRDFRSKSLTSLGSAVVCIAFVRLVLWFKEASMRNSIYRPAEALHSLFSRGFTDVLVIEEPLWCMVLLFAGILTSLAAYRGNYTLLIFTCVLNTIGLYPTIWTLHQDLSTYLSQLSIPNLFNKDNMGHYPLFCLLSVSLGTMQTVIGVATVTVQLNFAARQPNLLPFGVNVAKYLPVSFEQLRLLGIVVLFGVGAMQLTVLSSQMFFEVIILMLKLPRVLETRVATVVFGSFYQLISAFMLLFIDWNEELNIILIPLLLVTTSCCIPWCLADIFDYLRRVDDIRVLYMATCRYGYGLGPFLFELTSTGKYNADGTAVSCAFGSTHQLAFWTLAFEASTQLLVLCVVGALWFCIYRIVTEHTLFGVRLNAVTRIQAQRVEALIRWCGYLMFVLSSVIMLGYLLGYFLKRHFTEGIETVLFFGLFAPIQICLSRSASQRPLSAVSLLLQCVFGVSRSLTEIDYYHRQRYWHQRNGAFFSLQMVGWLCHCVSLIGSIYLLTIITDARFHHVDDESRMIEPMSDELQAEDIGSDNRQRDNVDQLETEVSREEIIA